MSQHASSKNNVDSLDTVTRNLNRLARQSSEGYMEIIDQKEFDKAKDPKSTVYQGNVVESSHLSKDVESVFQRICESIELYKTDNI